jgi:signal transduction histidine kinase
MTSWRTLALVASVAGAGAVGTMAVGAATGMGSGDLAHLLGLLVPAATVTVVAAVASRPLLARASLRQRFVTLALMAIVVSLANLAVLTRQMFVSDHDATLVAVLLLYSIGAGVGAALVLARSSSAAVKRLGETAEALGTGDLDARAGDVGAGPEFQTLARTLDAMASRLQESRRRELALEGTRRDLITAVSHDLRTPLASLRAMVEAIDEGVVADQASMRRYAGEMRGAVLQLSGMVDDLFELAQLDAGAIEAETRRARVDEVVRAAVAAVEPSVRRKGLALVADLGGADEVACSPRLTRVLQNLLVNAVRHTPADGTVRIGARRDADRLELAVEDTGEGIAPEHLGRVFEPFFRGDPSRSGGGAGLGLALAKRIVETLGGRISVESSPSAGSRFAVELPISRARSAG